MLALAVVLYPRKVLLTPSILVEPALYPNALLYEPRSFSDKAFCPNTQFVDISPPPNPMFSPLILTPLFTIKLPLTYAPPLISRAYNPPELSVPIPTLPGI